MITVKKQVIQGIVIKNETYKETSSKIIVLNETGIHSFIIKSGNKIENKLRSLSQVLTEVELVTTTDRVLNTVTEGVVLNNFTIIKDDSLKMLVSLALLEVVYSFFDALTDLKGVYTFLKNLLGKLVDTKYPKAILTLFEIKMWYAIGTYPNFKNCVSCGSAQGAYFNLELGGNLCLNCRNSKSYSLEISKLIELIFYIKVDNINDAFLKIVNDYFDELNKMVKIYYETYFDYRNKHKKLLEKLLN